MSTDTTKTIDEDQEEAAKKRDVRPRHPEALALQRILWELDELPLDVAGRVVDFVYARHGYLLQNRRDGQQQTAEQVQQTLDRR